MNYEVNNRKYVVKGISEALLSRLINAVKSDKFIGDKPHSVRKMKLRFMECGAEIIRESYWRQKLA